ELDGQRGQRNFLRDFFYVHHPYSRAACEDRPRHIYLYYTVANICEFISYRSRGPRTCEARLLDARHGDAVEFHANQRDRDAVKARVAGHFLIENLDAAYDCIAGGVLEHAAVADHVVADDDAARMDEMSHHEI